MSKVRNAPGYAFRPRTKRLRIQWNPGSTDGFHSPILTMKGSVTWNAEVSPARVLPRTDA